MDKRITINDIIKELSEKMSDNPDELSKYLVIITANLLKYGQDRIDKDVLQSKKWVEIRLDCETDGQADKRIKAADEWRNWQMSIVMEKNLLEMIRSIKSRLKSLTNELRSY